MMKFAHPVVLLFGAGATRGGLRKKAIPPPVDADFFEITGQIKGHGTPKLAGVVLNDVWGLYDRVASIGLGRTTTGTSRRAKELAFLQKVPTSPKIGKSAGGFSKS